MKGFLPLLRWLSIPVLIPGLERHVHHLFQHRVIVKTAPFQAGVLGVAGLDVQEAVICTDVPLFFCKTDHLGTPYFLQKNRTVLIMQTIQASVNILSGISTFGILCVMIVQALKPRKSSSHHDDAVHTVITYSNTRRSKAHARSIVLCLLILLALGVELFNEAPVTRLFVLKVIVMTQAFFFLLLHATLMKIWDRSIGR